MKTMTSQTAPALRTLTAEEIDAVFGGTAPAYARNYDPLRHSWTGVEAPVVFEEK